MLDFLILIVAFMLLLIILFGGLAAPFWITLILAFVIGWTMRAVLAGRLP